MIIGFTGTQRGMTQRQKDALTFLIYSYVQHTSGHLFMRNGDCIGADHEAGYITQTMLRDGNLHLHPSNIREKRAFQKGLQITEPLPPLKRNRYIAGAVAGFPTHVLIACPGESHEVQRSGTWATIRYARKAGTPVIILLP